MNDYNFTNLEYLSKNIKETYKQNNTLHEELDEIIHDLKKGIHMKQHLQELQEIQNKTQNFELQIEINRIRNAFNIPDESMLMKRTDGYFAQ